jgi:hypothetical protein
MSSSVNPTMRIWDQVKYTDPKYVKKLNWGAGLHTVDAMHTTERMTKIFGPCGYGWGWNILKDENITLASGHMVKEILMQLWWKDPKDGKIREVAPQAGVAQIDNPKTGKLDEYYYKKAITEAFSKCSSLLGMSADVYFGMFDNPAYSKWVERKFMTTKTKKDQDNEDDV